MSRAQRHTVQTVMQQVVPCGAAPSGFHRITVASSNDFALLHISAECVDAPQHEAAVVLGAESCLTFVATILDHMKGRELSPGHNDLFRKHTSKSFRDEIVECGARSWARRRDRLAAKDRARVPADRLERVLSLVASRAAGLPLQVRRATSEIGTQRCRTRIVSFGGHYVGSYLDHLWRFDAARLEGLAVTECKLVDRPADSFYCPSCAATLKGQFVRKHLKSAAHKNSFVKCCMAAIKAVTPKERST